MATLFDDWFSPLRRAPSPSGSTRAQTSLLCFPYSGMGVSMFASWRNLLGDDIAGYAVRLPGREDKLREPARTDLLPLAEELADAIVQRKSSTAVALAGFSLGGLLAFEVARAMRRRNAKAVLLAVGATRAPNGQWPRSELHALDEDAFLERLDRRYGGVAWEVLENKEMRRLVVPMLRSDIQMVETYEYRLEPPLECEVLTLIGAEDQTVTAEHAAPWGELAAAHRSSCFPGGHFFARSHTEQVVAAVIDSVRLRARDEQNREG